MTNLGAPPTAPSTLLNSVNPKKKEIKVKDTVFFYISHYGPEDNKSLFLGNKVSKPILIFFNFFN